MSNIKRRMNTVTLKSGSEGPLYDPYHWDEISIDRPDGTTVTWRDGSIGYQRLIVTRGEQTLLSWSTPYYSVERMVEEFVRRAGCDPRRLRRAHEENERRRVASHLASCRSDIEWVSGYPGETLGCCRRCGHVLSSHFSRSAVE